MVEIAAGLGSVTQPRGTTSATDLASIAAGRGRRPRCPQDFGKPGPDEGRLQHRVDPAEGRRETRDRLAGLDLALWPPEEIGLDLDTGADTTEQPDDYDGLICTPGGRVRLGPRPGNVWETMLFLGHPGGLKFRGTGSNAWTISGTLDTWTRGGDLATWHSQETCGGRCKGFLDMVVRIRPLPGP